MSRPVIMPRATPLGEKETCRVAVIDIGSHSIACAVAEMRPIRTPGIRTHRCSVLSYSAQRSAGVKGGLIVDAAAAADTVRSVVDAAERGARATITSVVVGTTCGRLASERLSADVPLPGDYVRDADVSKVFTVAAGIASGGERVTLHALPAGFALDGQRGIVEPVGMRADLLTADMHLVTAEGGPIANLIDCIESCQLGVEAIVASPYASALAVLSDDEIEHGATVIDLGGGTTTVASFDGGALSYVDAIALGGEHITRDISRVLRQSMAQAERLKVLQGNAFAPVADYDSLSDAFDSEDLSHEEKLGEAVRSRSEEIFDLVKQRLDRAGSDGALSRVVLTGGGSQLSGMAELAQSILGSHVRLGRPQNIYGSESATGPAAATLAGLCQYPTFASRERFGSGAMSGAGGYWSRFGEWIRESF
ncbi:MAG: cell division protein FtsA [Pseudomonadota bacterium]